MTELVDRSRAGEGPAFLLCHTYRYKGHHVGDINRGYYRSKEEEEEWVTERDPLNILSTWLIDTKLADQAIFDRIARDVYQEVEAAVQFALDTPYPHQSEVTQHVYVK